MLRNHWHVLLVVPLVVIAITWPTFPRIFNGDEFWLHTSQHDKWIPFWLAWHVENVLAGQAQFYYSDAIFHPQGLSLAFQHHELPHTILFLGLQRILPADDAFNLLYLLFRCFNALCGYLLIHHLIRDRWIALFGAVAISVAAAHPNVVPIADINLYATLPLTMYFYHRSVFESRWKFAVLAGICSGMTALIGEYTYVFTLISVIIYAIFLAWKHWRKPVFWRQCLLFFALSGSFALLRFFPLILDSTLRNQGIARYEDFVQGKDILDFLVYTPNPISGDFLHSVFNVPPDSSHSNGYLGYINVVLLGCAIFCKPWRRKLAPWIATLIFFVMMRMGHYLIYNGPTIQTLCYRHTFWMNGFLLFLVPLG